MSHQRTNSIDDFLCTSSDNADPEPLVLYVTICPRCGYVVVPNCGDDGDPAVDNPNYHQRCWE